MRRATWENDLNQYMIEANKRAWGDYECGHFVAGAVEAMTGQNLKTIEYTDAESLKAALEEDGSKTLYNYLCKRFGRHIHPATAKRGDVVQTRRDGEACLGILFSRNKAFFITDGGLAPLGILTCERAWHVPYG